MNKKYLKLAMNYISKYPNSTIHEIDYITNNKREGSRFIGRQLFDLVDNNMIRPSGIKICSRSGNRSIVWKVK